MRTTVALRENRVTIMLSDDELVKLKALAELSGQTMSGWLRANLILAPSPNNQ